MDFALTEDQEAIRTAFVGFFAKECPIERVRASEELQPTGFDAPLWQALAAMGAPGMAIAERHGGGGASLLDLHFVAHAAGHALAPVPIVEHVVATRLLSRSNGALDTGTSDSATTDITTSPDGTIGLSSLVAGDRIATLALHRPQQGILRVVPAGAVAEVVVAFDGDELIAVSKHQPGDALRNTARAPIAHWSIADARRDVLASGDEARVLFARARAEWRALTACALTGLAARALEIGLDYVKTRHQFDVPIGSFQAVQHGLAECAALNEGASWFAAEAVWSLDEGLPDAEQTAHMAFLYASEVAQRTTDRSLHYHGGYGFMLEYDIQLAFRRARGWSLIDGDVGASYQELADAVYGPATRQTWSA